MYTVVVFSAVSVLGVNSYTTHTLLALRIIAAHVGTTVPFLSVRFVLSVTATRLVVQSLFIVSSFMFVYVI